MATNPNEIRLSKEERERLASMADKNGKPWREAFREAIGQYERGIPGDEVDIDEEIRAVLGIEPEDLEPVSLEEMRRILAKCSGSLAADIIADREDRL
jgi:transcriptional regulator with XRE-family HTH domain